jgi:hypothetical protein
MIRNTLLLFLALVLAFSFEASAQRSNEAAEKVIENIIGRWQLQKVYAGGREITSNPNGEASWIEFNEDGTYRMQADEGNDQGSYRLNENHSVLYLESEGRKETSSAVSLPNLTEYNITMREGTLSMQSRTANSATTKYIYARPTEGQGEGNNK